MNLDKLKIMIGLRSGIKQKKKSDLLLKMLKLIFLIWCQNLNDPNYEFKV